MENVEQDFVIPEMDVEYDEDVLFNQDSNHLRLILTETVCILDIVITKYFILFIIRQIPII